MAVAGTTAAEAQRDRIVWAAVDIFSKRGYRATSMNDVAAEVGLSKPTLYHYFRSKDELLVRIYGIVLDESLDQVMEQTKGLDPLAAIHQLIVSRVVYTCNQQEVLRVCFEEEHELPPRLAGGLLARRKAFEEYFEDLVARHLKRLPPSSTTPAIAPKVYVNMCLGAVNWCYKWFRADGYLTPEALGEQIASSLVKALEPVQGEKVAVSA